MKLAKISLKDNNGFTIIELILFIVILTSLAGMGLFLSLDFYRNYVLNIERDTIVAALWRTRSRAQNNINQSPHGLYIDERHYILFQGAGYLSRIPIYDEIIPSSSPIKKSGVKEVVFSQLSGDINIEGEIILSNGIKSLNIVLNNEGRINW